MADYCERLHEAMLLRTVSVSMLAKEIGVTYQAVKKVLDGKSAALSAENNARAARFLKINSYWLATGEETLRIVEVMSAASSSPTPLQPTAPTVHYLGTRLAEKLKPLDRSTRDVAAAMLKAIAERPEEPEKMIDALASLLGEFEIEHMDIQVNRGYGN